MTTDYSYSLSSLAQILSALEGERRNPNTKRNAIKAIERAASRLGLDSDDVFDAADGLLSGRLSAAAWLAQLRDEGCGPTSVVAEPPAEPAAEGRAGRSLTSCPTPSRSRSRRGAAAAAGRTASRRG